MAIVETAVQELQIRRSRRGAYAGQAIFLDADQRDNLPDRAGHADRLLLDHAFHAIWSRPAFEALLLKHLKGCERLKPATSALALQQLQRRWPDYRKSMVAHDVREKLDRSHVTRAAEVLPELRAFLVAIRLLT